MKPLLQQRKRAGSTLRRLVVQWMALLWIGSLAAPAQEPPPEPETNQPAPAVQEPSAGSETNPPAAAEQRPPMTGGEIMPPPGADQAPPAMEPEESQPEESVHKTAGNVAVKQPAVGVQGSVASVRTNPVAVSEQKPTAAADTNPPVAEDQRQSRRRNNRQAEPQQAAAAGVGTNELAFKIIYERNIFNPNRGPRYSRRNDEDAPKPVKIEGFSLVGTLLSEKGAYAFFDGTEARYRAALKTSNTIAGYTLAAITPNFVTLRTPTNTFDLTMNMQMRRQDEGDWELTVAKGSWNSTNSASSTTATAVASDEEGGNDAGAEEVMKRLMKKRLEELKK